MEKDFIREMIDKRNKGIPCGIPSICTANDLVLEACLDQGKHLEDIVLIESTANQVNQDGGYTGMTPETFKQKVYKLADKVGFPRNQIILGGDHVGPLTWFQEPEEIAMKKAEDMVRAYVGAGFKKIHLDTSMRLGDDDKQQPLSVRTIARRGARLFQVGEETYQELRKKNPEAARPSYIVGSEVPIPGGEQEKDDQIAITRPEDLHETIQIYKEELENIGLGHLFSSIVGLVVQPGVEFGDENLVRYNRSETMALSQEIDRYPGLVLEGHSTDYQSRKQLKEMVEDGIAILKVGPALTFAVREALFALSYMEKYTVPEEKRADYIETLEDIMVRYPKNWEKYYKGTEEENAVKRKFSLSDRCRYYYDMPEIQECIQKLFANLDGTHIPLGLLHQFMRRQYYKVLNGNLRMEARELVKDVVVERLEDYYYATRAE